jgi:hypothetical protein
MLYKLESTRSDCCMCLMWFITGGSMKLDDVLNVEDDVVVKQG